jgi:hypothetical protein
MNNKIPNLTSQKCSTCFENKDIEHFFFRRDVLKYRKQCKVCHSEKKKKYKKDNSESISIQNKLYRRNKILTDPDFLKREKGSAIRTRSKNREAIRARGRSDKYKSVKREYIRNKLATDPQFKIRRILRGRFSAAISKEYKRSSCLDILGCTIREFKEYIESQFVSEMTWSNHGKWHIDHIIPCCSFDLTDPAQQAICFHYTNMQPLWAWDNLSKAKSIRAR